MLIAILLHEKDTGIDIALIFHFAIYSCVLVSSNWIPVYFK